MSLYKLPDELREIQQAIEDNNGEITQEIEFMLEKYQQKEVSNFVQVVNLLEGYESAEKFLKEKKHMITELINEKRNTINRMKLFIMNSIKKLGKHKIENDALTISVVKSPPKVVIDDEELIPEEYKRVEVVISASDLNKLLVSGIPYIEKDQSVDKTKIKDDLKDGVTISGARLEDSEHIRIRG